MQYIIAMHAHLIWQFMLWIRCIMINWLLFTCIKSKPRSLINIDNYINTFSDIVVGRDLTLIMTLVSHMQDHIKMYAHAHIFIRLSDAHAVIQYKINYAICIIALCSLACVYLDMHIIRHFNFNLKSDNANA